MKKTTKLIVMSLLTVALCVSLIGGATMALFTSESSVDIVVSSGRVDVQASVDSLRGFSLDKTEILPEDGTFSTGGTFAYDAGKLTLDRIVAGDGVTFELVLTNNSTVAIKYQVRFQSSNADFAGEDGLQVTVNGSSAPVSGTTYATDWSEIVPATSDAELVRLPIRVELPEKAGNEYQSKSCTLTIAVLACQGNAHTDNPDPGAAISLFNMADLMAFARSVNSGVSYLGETVELLADVDFNEPSKAMAIVYTIANEPTAAEEWQPIGIDAAHAFQGTFDGKGHTIANFAAKTTDDAKAAGLFGYVNGATIEHLHFVGANVSASGADSVAAVVAGQATGNVTLRDITVEGTCTAADEATVGGLVGSLTGEGSQLSVADSSFAGEGAQELVGEAAAGSDVAVVDSSVSDSEGNTVAEWDDQGKRVHRVATAQELVDLVQNGGDLSQDKILLVDDLDFTDVTPSGKAYMTNDCLFELDGKDGDKVHTISGMQYALFLYVKGGSYLHDLTIDLNVNLTDPASNKLARGAIAENIVGSDISDEVTIENIVVQGEAINMRAAFFDESGEDGKTGTLNFINCRSAVNMTSTGSGEISKMAAFLNLPDAWDVNFTDCVNEGTITYNTTLVSNAVMGGFVSYAQGNDSNTLTFTNCVNAGNVIMTYTGGGASDPDIGGFIGKVQRSTHVKFVDCANTATVSCTYPSQTISIGGFVGQSTGGSITFEGTNVNGAYTDSGEHMVAEPDKGNIIVNVTNDFFNAGEPVRAGGFIGYPGSAAVTFGGTVVNAGKVTVAQRENSSSKFIAYAGGLLGHTAISVTFADDCKYYNLGDVTVTVAHETDSVVYVGGIVGYVSANVYALGAAVGNNYAAALSASGAQTMYIGSFAGCVTSSCGVTDESLVGFTDSAARQKIGSII